MSSAQLLRLVLLVIALVAVVFARSKASALDPMRLEFLAEKRDATYGWNDCEFSPLSCLLRRRRQVDFAAAPSPF